MDGMKWSNWPTAERQKWKLFWLPIVPKSKTCYIILIISSFPFPGRGVCFALRAHTPARCPFLPHHVFSPNENDLHLLNGFICVHLEACRIIYFTLYIRWLTQCHIIQTAETSRRRSERKTRHALMTSQCSGRFKPPVTSHRGCVFITNHAQEQVQDLCWTSSSCFRKQCLMSLLPSVAYFLFV